MSGDSGAPARKPVTHYGDLTRLDRAGGQPWASCVKVSGAHWDAEMGSITQMLTEKSRGDAPALLFDDIPGYPKGYRTLYGHFSSVRRVALTLGLPLEYERKVDIVKKYHERIQSMKPLPPRFVKDGPILENVIEGEKVDVLKFPVPRHHEKDTARYIGTANCVITQDPGCRLVQSRLLSQPGLRRQDDRLPDHRGQARAHPPRQIFRARADR